MVSVEELVWPNRRLERTGGKATRHGWAARQRLFGFSGPLPNSSSRYNATSTQQVPIVRRARGSGERELAQVRWGLIPFWAKDSTIGSKLINARAGGIADKPAFRAAFR